jgi:hypothetical protein
MIFTIMVGLFAFAQPNAGAFRDIQSRCDLVDAVFSATGTVEFGGSRTLVGPLRKEVPTAARVGGRIVVRVLLLAGESKGRPFFQGGETCDDRSFILVEQVRDPETGPQDVIQLHITATSRLSESPKFRFRMDRVGLKKPPPGWYGAKPVPVYRGSIQERQGRWVAVIETVRGR